MRYVENGQIRRAVKWWLVAGLVMIFFQIIIGGVTRLTGSGLSITKWEIVTGTLPPLGETAWNEAFDAYKMTPQYAKINQGMALGDFKFIYFWEYFHRLWARSMGFVFLFPFLFFWKKGWLSRRLFFRLLGVVGLAAVVATFGWIMVASGLVNRPWVNAYKLTLHLSLALLTFGYLLWATFEAFRPNVQRIENQRLARFSRWLTVLVSLQIMIGGVMSGMKAGLFYPTWPTMRGEWLPGPLLDGANWRLAHLIDYDTHPFMAALVQFSHRGLAYILTILVVIFFIKTLKVNALRTEGWLLLGAVSVQVLLGIFTLINCLGTVPVGLGVCHQGWAVVLLSGCLWVNYRVRR